MPTVFFYKSAQELVRAVAKQMPARAQSLLECVRVAAAEAEESKLITPGRS